MRLALAVLSLASGGCILSTFDYEPCSDNAQCRDAFGWGWTCGSDDLCAEVTAPPRCNTTLPADLFQNRTDYGDAVVLGMNYDRASFDSEVKAMELAVDQVGLVGGLDGRTIALVECTNEENPDLDALSQKEANVEVAVWLANSLGVPAILGPATSTRTEAAFLAVEKYGTLVMSPSATSPALTDLDGLTSTDADPGLLWRTAPPDSLQGEVIARCMTGGCAPEVDLDVSKVLVIYETGAYGEGLQEAFYDNYAGAGRTVDLIPFANATDRDEAVVSAAHGDYDEVLFIASEKTDVLAFLFAAGQLEAFTRAEEPLGIFFADGAYYLDIYQDAAAYDGLYAQIYGTRPTINQQSEVYDSFAATYSAAFGGLDAGSAAYAAYAYDATWLVQMGVVWSLYQQGDISGLGIARGLRQVSAGDPVDIKPTSWSTVRAHFSEAQPIDVNGVSGSLDYNPTTGETSAPIEVWQVEYQSGSGYAFVEVIVIED